MYENRCIGNLSLKYPHICLHFFTVCWIRASAKGYCTYYKRRFPLNPFSYMPPIWSGEVKTGLKSACHLKTKYQWSLKQQWSPVTTFSTDNGLYQAVPWNHPHSTSMSQTLLICSMCEWLEDLGNQHEYFIGKPLDNLSACTNYLSSSASLQYLMFCAALYLWQDKLLLWTSGEFFFGALCTVQDHKPSCPQHRKGFQRFWLLFVKTCFICVSHLLIFLLSTFSLLLDGYRKRY